MSIFNNYDRPGKGVDKNESEKLAVVIYFETAVRKFWKFVQGGILFSLLSIPWLLILYVGSYFILYMPISVIIRDMNAEQSSMMTSMICSTMAILIVTLWGSGPSSAAFSFIMRSFVREEPIWIVSDSKKVLKENIKQGLAVMLIDIIILAAASLAMEMYWAFAQSMPNMAAMFQIMMYVLLFMLIIYTMMHPYIYQMMITFDNSLKELYKNALFITLAKLPLSLLFTVIAAAIIIVPIWFFGIYPLIVGIVVLSAGYIITRFPSEYYAMRSIKKEMLKK